MQKTASGLGRGLGLTGAELNCILKNQGFLTGEPGDYTPTEKAADYVEERDYHRGCGGYSWYNRSWTTRAFDETIMDELDINDDVISEVRDELRKKRAARREEYNLNYSRRHDFKINISDPLF